MDWVVNGKKYDVENSFGVVDIESIMARIEDSKESARNSTIVDQDGANEIQTVQLTPKNWAQLCQDKLAQWKSSNGNFSLEQLEAEIDRLNQLSLSLDALAGALNGKTFPVDSTVTDPGAMTTASATLSTAYTALYKAQGKLNSLKVENADQASITAAVTVVEGAQKQVHDAQTQYTEASYKENKYALETFGGSNTAAATWITTQKAKVQASLDKLTAMLKDSRFQNRSAIPVIAGAQADDTDANKPSQIRNRHSHARRPFCKPHF
jgi:hypothetical protein